MSDIRPLFKFWQRSTKSSINPVALMNLSSRLSFQWEGMELYLNTL
jgi:hypothetical protein